MSENKKILQNNLDTMLGWQAEKLSSEQMTYFKPEVVIATTTFYNSNSKSDSYRADLAKQTVRAAIDNGHEIVVVDGGSPIELLKEFERTGARVFSETERGMGKGRRQAIREAYNVGRAIIAWTEPEKVDYIHSISETAHGLIRSKADIVIPKRRSMESYPTAQQYAEPMGNAFWKELTGADLDMWFGPRTWKRELSDYFLNYNGEYGDKWDSIFIPVMDAIIDGKKVAGIDVDYTHPKVQSQDEEHDLTFYKKRIEQLQNLLPALETHWKKQHQK